MASIATCLLSPANSELHIRFEKSAGGPRASVVAADEVLCYILLRGHRDGGK
jgi:hypothetical protein